MKRKLIMDMAVLAGEVMLSSGAETYRVEDTMCHILRTTECESIEAFALMTGIVATINGDEMEQPITVVRTIQSRSTNMNNIIKVNEISRRYCGGKLSLDEAYTQLKCVKEKQYRRREFNIATAAITTGFAMMLGGSMLDVTAATAVGFWLAACMSVGSITRMNGIVLDILSCIGIAFLTMILREFAAPSLNMDIVIVSSIMPIVPGVAITNAIRDILQGDYLSGCARTLEAFLKAASIALGAGIGMALGGVL